MLTSLRRAATLATVLASSAATDAWAQSTAPDPSQPEAMEAETMPPTGGADAMDQAQGTQSDQANTMAGGLMSGPMDRPAAGQGMMCSEMCSGMMGQGATCSEMCSGMMDRDAMGQGMMSHGVQGQGQMEGAMQPAQMGSGMPDPMMKIMFAIADADASGGMSLDELAAIQERVFRAVDANEDGSVTPEEMQAFIGE